MLRSAAMIVLWALGSRALAQETTLPAGTRVRLRTVAPPWNEDGAVRDFGGRVLREDDDTVIIQRKDEEPAVLTRKGRWLKAELVAADDRFLTLRVPWNAGDLRIPRGAVVGLETSKGGSAARGVFIGAVVGAAFCAAFGAATASEDDFFDKSDSAVLLGSAGLLTGALAGPWVFGERWRPVDGGSIRVTVGPSRAGGVRAALTVRFE